MREIIQSFFKKQYENSINQKTLYYDYIFPENEVMDYIRKVINIPLEEFISFIYNDCKNTVIFPADVFQFSNIDDATLRLCSVLQDAGNPGVDYLQGGKLLLNDGKERLKGAYLKYGENHLKTGAAIGLLFELTRTYFLSIYGLVYDKLSSEEYEKLLIRLVLRNKLIIRIIRATNIGTLNLRELFYMLSDSTYIRRKSNVKSILSILKNSKEYNFDEILNKVVF